jgi:hypothetical protein
MTEPRVVMREEKGRKASPLAPDPEGAWRLVAVIAVGLGCVGWFDVVLMWYPLRLADLQWRFGTASGTFDALPLGTIGFGLVMAAAIALGWRRALAGGAVFAGLVGVALLAVAVMYGLGLPVVLRGLADDNARAFISRAVTKTVVFAVLYVVLYFTVGWLLWRRLRSGEEGTT